jgi:hypothetical protein
MQFLQPHPNRAVLWLLLPMGFLVYTVPSSLALLKRGFGFKEFIWPVMPDIVPAGSTAGAGVPSLPAGKVRHLEELEIVEVILRRQFLAPPQWASRGLLGKWFWKLLDRRQQVLTELVFPNGVAISTDWRNVFKLMLVVTAAYLVSLRIDELLKYWVIVVGLVVSTIFVLSINLGSGKAFQLVLCSGVNIPRYAAFGIGYDELSSLLLKFSCVQFPPLLSFIAAWFCVAAQSSQLTLIMGLALAFKLACIVLTSRYILIVCRFSGCTNDTTFFKLRGLLIMGGMVIAILLFLGAVVAGLILQSWGGWLCCAGAGLDAFALHRFYRWYYQRNYFDLMSTPRRR